MIKTTSFLFVFSVASFVSGGYFEIPEMQKGTDEIDDLQPGHWYEVPNSHIRDHVPVPSPPGNPRSVIQAWSGGAYDTKRDRLIVWGGGHNDYGGNEIYVFDVNTLKWSRIWGPSQIEMIQAQKGGECVDTYADGNPVSRHTYNGLQYLPSLDKFWIHSGSRYCGGGSRGKDTWIFDFDSLMWERKSDSPDSKLGEISGYDPVTGHVFVVERRDILEYDPVVDTWTDRGDGYAPNYMTADVDPENRLLVAVGDGLVRVWDLNTWQYTASQPTTDGSAIVNSNAAGFVYDPVIKRFVGWIGGTDVYTLDVKTWTWEKHSPAATNTVTPTQPPEKGTYGRFRYIPSRNAYIVINNIDENVYIYKFSDNVTSIDNKDIEKQERKQKGEIEVWPNPFNAMTKIRVIAPNIGMIPMKLSIYNLNGQLIELFAIPLSEANEEFTVDWDASQFSTGIYFMRLEGAPRSLFRKITLIK